MKRVYRAIKCPCGSPNCKNWLVDPVAAYQGVSFTEHQAKAVASFLNYLEESDPREKESDDA